MARRVRGKKPHGISSENDLCNRLSETAQQLGWKVYPETSGCDLLLVATETVKTRNAEPGDQIGIQAKLRPNVEVLSQALPTPHSTHGPHYHGVLVPHASRAFSYVAGRLGLVVFAAVQWDRYGFVVDNRLRSLRRLSPIKKYYYSEPLWFPEIEIWTPAGVRSPKSITPWKINAVRLCLFGVKRGYLLNSDFLDHNISITRWRLKRWIVSGEKIGRAVKYKLVEENRPPHILYPEITARLLEDGAKEEK